MFGHLKKILRTSQKALAKKILLLMSKSVDKNATKARSVESLAEKNTRVFSNFEISGDDDDLCGKNSSPLKFSQQLFDISIKFIFK